MTGCARLEFESSSPEATLGLGEALGRILEGGEVIGLVGELGSGKTVFVRGLVRGLGGDPRDVTSPTFVLHHRYAGRLSVDHFDAYRLSGAGGLSDLGIDEAFAGQGVCVVEWADRCPQDLPPRILRVELVSEGPEARRIRLIPSDPSLSALVERLSGELSRALSGGEGGGPGG